MNSKVKVGHLRFYQSAIVEYTDVDLSNPLHVRLLQLIAEDNVPSAEATKLMKKAGFEPSQSTWNTVCWSADLFIHEEGIGHGTSSRHEVYLELIAAIS